jgi:hypothetical protein
VSTSTPNESESESASQNPEFSDELSSGMSCDAKIISGENNDNAINELDDLSSTKCTTEDFDPVSSLPEKISITPEDFVASADTETVSKSDKWNSD